MKYAVGFALLGFCGGAFAEPLSTAAFIVADTLFATGAGGAITGLTAAGSAAASGLAGLLGAKAAGKQSAGSAPKAAVMPVSDDKAVEEARRRQIAAIQARSGRASTILSDNGAKLGG